jgi:hypothetical protein
MAFKAGYLGWFALDNVAGTLTNLQPYIDNVTVPQNVDMLDVSVLGTSAKGFIPGLTDGDQIGISGPYDVTVHTHLTAVKAAQAAGSSTASYMWGPGGSVASQAKINGECWLASYQLSTGVTGRAEWSATLQVSGSVTNGTF